MNRATSGAPAKTPKPPSGIWAIASELAPQDLSRWMDVAAVANAWTFRLPLADDPNARQMLMQLRRRSSWLAVHGEWEWANHCQADAFIAGSRSAAIADLPASTMQIGAAAHDHDELKSAYAAAANFAFYSPIWETPSKIGILAPRGLSGLLQVCQEYNRPSTSMPIIALGGIETPEQVAQCRRQGAHAVAVLRAAQDASLLAEMVAAWNSTAAGKSDS